MPGKPDPEIYVRSAKLLGRCPEDCMVFEDSLSGVLAAKRANIGRVYGFGPGYTPARYEPVGGVDGAFDDFSTGKTSILPKISFDGSIGPSIFLFMVKFFIKKA